MRDELKSAILRNVEHARISDADQALKYSQAALNLAQVIRIDAEVKANERHAAPTAEDAGEEGVKAEAEQIAELKEELHQAKKIIVDFVWPPDRTPEQMDRFREGAARFTGCMAPQPEESSESEEPADEEG